jgi:hypothetical protein
MNDRRERHLRDKIIRQIERILETWRELLKQAKELPFDDEELKAVELYQIKNYVIGIAQNTHNIIFDLGSGYTQLRLEEMYRKQIKELGYDRK